MVSFNRSHGRRLEEKYSRRRPAIFTSLTVNQLRSKYDSQPPADSAAADPRNTSASIRKERADLLAGRGGISLDAGFIVASLILHGPIVPATRQRNLTIDIVTDLGARDPSDFDVSSKPFFGGVLSLDRGWAGAIVRL